MWQDIALRLYKDARVDGTNKRDLFVVNSGYDRAVWIKR